MKIKNRSHNDQAVAFQPLSQSSPFRVVQALVEVKSNCYVTVPIQVVKHPVLLISISSHLFSVPAARAWRSCPGIKVEMERGRPDRHLEGLRCLVLLTEMNIHFSMIQICFSQLTYSRLALFFLIFSPLCRRHNMMINTSATISYI